MAEEEPKEEGTPVPKTGAFVFPNGARYGDTQLLCCACLLACSGGLLVCTCVILNACGTHRGFEFSRQLFVPALTHTHLERHSLHCTPFL
eukprot:3935545-Rhodomonas_salina.5